MQQFEKAVPKAVEMDGDECRVNVTLNLGALPKYIGDYCGMPWIVTQAMPEPSTGQIFTHIHLFRWDGSSMARKEGYVECPPAFFENYMAIGDDSNGVTFHDCCNGFERIHQISRNADDIDKVVGVAFSYRLADRCFFALRRTYEIVVYEFVRAGYRILLDEAKEVQRIRYYSDDNQTYDKQYHVSQTEFVLDSERETVSHRGRTWSIATGNEIE